MTKEIITAIYKDFLLNIIHKSPEYKSFMRNKKKLEKKIKIKKEQNVVKGVAREQEQKLIKKRQIEKTDVVSKLNEATERVISEWNAIYENFEQFDLKKYEDWLCKRKANLQAISNNKIENVINLIEKTREKVNRINTYLANNKPIAESIKNIRGKIHSLSDSEREGLNENIALLEIKIKYIKEKIEIAGKSFKNLKRDYKLLQSVDTTESDYPNLTIRSSNLKDKGKKPKEAEEDKRKRLEKFYQEKERRKEQKKLEATKKQQDKKQENKKYKEKSQVLDLESPISNLLKTITDEIDFIQEALSLDMANSMPASCKLNDSLNNELSIKLPTIKYSASLYSLLRIFEASIQLEQVKKGKFLFYSDLNITTFESLSFCVRNIVEHYTPYLDGEFQPVLTLNDLMKFFNKEIPSQDLENIFNEAIKKFDKFQFRISRKDLEEACLELRELRSWILNFDTSYSITCSSKFFQVSHFLYICYFYDSARKAKLSYGDEYRQKIHSITSYLNKKIEELAFLFRIAIHIYEEESVSYEQFGVLHRAMNHCIVVLSSKCRILRNV